MLYESVCLTETVPAAAHIDVFVHGLNSGSSRDHIQDWYTRNRHATLAQLVQEVHEHEALLRRRQYMDRTAAVYAGSSSSSKGTTTASTNKAAALLLQERLNKQEHMLQEMSPVEQRLMRSAFELAETNPKHGNAICQQCKIHVSPHVNAACRRQQREKADKAAGNQQALAAVGTATAASSSQPVDIYMQQLE